MPPERQDRDLVLPPRTFAFVLDNTSGQVSVNTGPMNTTLTNTQDPVTWAGKKPAVVTLDQAIQPFVRATENQYVILNDPAVDEGNQFPTHGRPTPATELSIGKKIVIPGPVTFALWPGQTAEVLDGHSLRSNEYLMLEVYEPKAAKKFADAEIAAPTAEGETPKDKGRKPARDFIMGQRIIKRGDEVSYYVPPTGIRVILDPDTNKHVREACTLGQLQYCVLEDENGNPRIETGPAVVFPKPTEKFRTERDGERVFRAIELNPQTGLYVKAVAEYQHDGDYELKVSRGEEMVAVKKGATVQEGDELFLTGSTVPIYVPRTEHSVIEYRSRRRDGSRQWKHYAVAVPLGNGRYVLNKTTGSVDLVKGHTMLLPDPRTHVIVRRVLDPKVVALMYPGNPVAEALNAQWGQQRTDLAEQFLAVQEDVAPVAAASLAQAGSLASSYAVTSSFGGEKLRRGSEFTPPREVTLIDTEYGAVRIRIWPGFAVLIADPSGKRRVVRGADDVLLEYHESLQALSLSTGRPKTTANPRKAVYLQVVNKVGDRFTVETRDRVRVTLELQLGVRFEGETQEEMQRWWEVGDYVALLTDQVRSRLANLAKRHGIQDFHEHAIDLIRDNLLGVHEEGKGKDAPKGRPGRFFPENNMRLYEVSLAERLKIEHPRVEELLERAQNTALEGAIQLSEARDSAQRQTELEAIIRGELEEKDKTSQKRSELALAEIQRELTNNLKAIAAELSAAEESVKVSELERSEEKAVAEQDQHITEARNKINLELLKGEVDQFIRRAGALDPQMIHALNAFGDQRFVEQLVAAVGPAAMASGLTTADYLRQLFEGTPLENVLETLTQRPLGNGRPEVEATTRA